MSLLNKLSIILFFSISINTTVSAKKVSGTVFDETGQPLPGASVMEKGTSNGTIANLDGFYSIEIKGNQPVLLVSFIGYSSIEVEVGRQSRIDIKLTPATKNLDEVVVVGYGSMRKSDLTGAIVSLKSDELETATSQSIEQALQGRAAGVQVSTTSAAPGGSSNIRVRGTNSLLSDGNPLYIIDGFPVESSDMNSFNVDNIASVEILKDASSTAIYGSRGANGVILITTKKGTTAKPKFDFNANLGFQDIYRKVELMNGQEFAEAFNEFLVNNGNAPYYDGSRRDRLTPEQIGEGTDWYDQIIKSGFKQNYSLAVHGGNNSNSYWISGSYYNHSGIIVGGNFSRFNLNINENVKITDWLNLNANTMLSRTNTNGSGDRTELEGNRGTLNSAMKMAPTIPVYDENGDYLPNDFPGAQGNENPLAYANEVLDNTILNNVLANLTFKITPLKDLDISVKLGTNVKRQQNNYYLSSETIEGGKVNGQATITNASTDYWINENIISYKKEINKHRFSAMGGFTMEENIWEQNMITATGIPTDAFSYTGVGSAETIGMPTVYKTRTALMSFLGRATYNYADVYLLTLTDRMDGNSGFSLGNKWGNFPSVSAAWRISQEKFMKNIDFLDNLKIRAGWGITGNSRIGSYRSLCLLTNSRYVLGDNTVAGIGPNKIGNADLRWESTEMYNLGLDVALLKYRLSLTADIYYKYTSDMLMKYDLPSTSGYTNAYINAGELENKGLEISLNARVLDGKKFKWTVSANVSFNRDKVVKLYNDEPLVLDLGDKQTIYIKEGQPIRQFSGLSVLGVFKDQEEINNYLWTNPETGQTNMIQPGVKPGDLKYEDLNNDGKINASDNIIYGSAFPDFTYGLNNQMKYANFTFDVFVTGSQGNWVQNRTLSYLQYTNNIRNNLSKTLVNRWTPTNTETNIPRLGANGQLPAFEDASYLRIQNIKLAYELPKKYLSGFNSVSIYASISNLYVWANYSGWDPDVNTFVGGEENVNVGLDQNSYPRPRTTSIGVNIKF